MVVFIGFVFLGVLGIWWLLDAYYVQKYVSEYNTNAGLEVSSFTLNTRNNTPDSQTRHSNLDELERLHDLLEKGVISQEEFDAKKAVLL